MKPYVKEIAADLIRRAEKTGDAFYDDSAMQTAVCERIDGINRIVDLCERGCLSSLTAVELLMAGEAYVDEDTVKEG